MNIIERTLQSIDKFQRKHRVFGFPYAVVKKFGDDSGGYQAALITYYGFLSLFPLLLVLVTVLQLLFQNNPSLQSDVTSSINNYFPAFGNQLQTNVHSMGRTGTGLAIGVLITLYGARGAADAIRFALDNMWQIPKASRSGFPKNILQSFGIIGCAGAGFLATAFVSSFSTALGHAIWVKVLLNIVGFIITTLVIGFIFRIATFHKIAMKDMWVGAVIAAFFIQLLLTFGSVLVAHQLKGLSSLYGTFAVVLGLFFWIYLIAQVVVYAAEVDTVRRYKLWPRSLTGEKTEADKRAYKLYPQTERYLKPEEEEVKVNIPAKS